MIIDVDPIFLPSQYCHFCGYKQSKMASLSLGKHHIMNEMEAGSMESPMIIRPVETILLPSGNQA
jgi:hypothetical protein